MCGGIVIGAMLFIFIKRNQYMKEAPHKLKVFILPETGIEEIQIVDCDFSKNWVKVKDGDNFPRYYFDKDNIWYSKYPDNPFFGLRELQVQVASCRYFKDNPEPITSHPLAPLVTSSSIMAAIDEDFALVIRNVSDQMMKLEKQLMQALSAHLNKGVVYISFIAIIVICCVALYFSFEAMQNSKQVMHAFGLK
jgi:hypothetical protein